MTVFERVKICKLSSAMKEQKKFCDSIELKDQTKIVNRNIKKKKERNTK